jgi:hypothetical protein
MYSCCHWRKRRESHWWWIAFLIDWFCLWDDCLDLLFGWRKGGDQRPTLYISRTKKWEQWKNRMFSISHSNSRFTTNWINFPRFPRSRLVTSQPSRLAGTIQGQWPIVDPGRVFKVCLNKAPHPHQYESAIGRSRSLHCPSDTIVAMGYYSLLAARMRPWTMDAINRDIMTRDDSAEPSIACNQAPSLSWL